MIIFCTNLYSLFENIDKELDNKMHLAFKVFSFLKVEYLDLNPILFEHKNFERAQERNHYYKS